MRVNGTTRKVPREAFEETEKSAMLAPPTEPFDVPLWAEHAKVHPDHHIQIARALYSVPTLYRNKAVRVRADKTTVKIYFGTDARVRRRRCRAYYTHAQEGREAGIAGARRRQGGAACTSDKPSRPAPTLTLNLTDRT
jgi:hypothetical protein